MPYQPFICKGFCEEPLRWPVSSYYLPRGWVTVLILTNEKAAQERLTDLPFRARLAAQAAIQSHINQQQLSDSRHPASASLPQVSTTRRARLLRVSQHPAG